MYFGNDSRRVVSAELETPEVVAWCLLSVWLAGRAHGVKGRKIYSEKVINFCLLP